MAWDVLTRAPSRRWVYILPGIHFCFALTTIVGFWAQHLPTWSSRAWDILFFVDFPVSVGMIIFAWGPEFLSPAWVLIACTWWWYFLSVCADRLTQRLLLRKPP